MKQQIKSNDIAIIGMSGRFPGAENIKEFMNNLINGKDSVKRNMTKSTGFVSVGGLLKDIDLFDASFFNISPREAEMMNPQHRLFLEDAWKLIESAGYNVELIDDQVSIYASSNSNIYDSLNENETLAGKFLNRINNEPDFLPTMVSYRLNLKGESIAVQTACSSSLVSVHMACQSIISGNSDLSIAGGVSITLPQQQHYKYQEGMIYSPDGYCRPFDAEARGTVEGHGLGLVLLKRADKAIRDNDHIYAIIKGSAVNNDGKLKLGFKAPSTSGQEAVIKKALSISEVPIESIRYVEAHGTGTLLGDVIEIDALTKAYRNFTEAKQFCAIGSVKSSVGHLIHAAGITGLIKAALCVHQGFIPKTLHYNVPNPKIEFEKTPFYVAEDYKVWDSEIIPRRAAVSSFGIGGTNAHLILEEAPKMTRILEEFDNNFYAITLSAISQDKLNIMKDNLKKHILNNPNLPLCDIAFTLNTGRKGFKCRFATVVKDVEELISCLESNVNNYNIFEEECLAFSNSGNVTISNKEVMFDKNAMLQLAKSWVKGKDIDWCSIFRDKDVKRVPLPTYPFTRQSFWREDLPKEKTDELISQPEGIDQFEFSSVNPLNNSEIQKKVGNIFKEILGLNEINYDEDLFELGGDSLTMAEILTDIEEEFKTTISLHDAFEAQNVKELSAIVINMLGKQEEKQGSSCNLKINDEIEVSSVNPCNISEIQKKVGSIFKEILGLNEINYDEDLFELGGDSLTMAEILTDIEEEFNITVSLHDAFEAQNVKELSAIVINMLGEQEKKQGYSYDLKINDEIITIEISKEDYLNKGVPKEAFNVVKKG